ncbi:hypothetical protein DID88_000444 [Monilinia fructigena]|uniref:Autophagy-related protein 27 n=1 Tax=Monilinia fructigena TaxID=38457 RepID=A0A395IHL2_9HELO|nr:hypothetical protein DID88_000444 [Monilinia fructigena]
MKREDGRIQTYTIDICQAIVKKGFYECPGGTRVCGITHVINEEEGSDATQQIVPFAGELENYGGGPLNAKLERLSNSKAHSDADKEGLRIELGGGFIGRGKDKRPQKAIVEFICDANRTGLENLLDKDKGDADILRLTWRTKHACENGPKDDKEDKKSSHWGFFTWFIIVAFLFNGRLFNIRLLAQLQQIWRTGLGSASSWRYDPRRSILTKGLV